jgi:hypothetical protein
MAGFSASCDPPFFVRFSFAISQALEPGTPANRTFAVPP